MNAIPSELYPQPLDTDLIYEEYDNIEVNRFYYVRHRSTDISGNPVVSMDYMALVMNKGAASIAVDIKKYRFTDTGPDWVDVESDAQDLRTFECDDVRFYRPEGTEPASTGDGESSGSDSEPESSQ